MLTTTVAGRTWNFSHAIGRNAAAGAGFTYPTAVAVAPGDVLYVLSRGSEGLEANFTAENKRIAKVSLDDQEFLGEFARSEFTWPTGLALDSDGKLYCSDEHENIIAVYDGDGERLGESVCLPPRSQLNLPVHQACRASILRFPSFPISGPRGPSLRYQVPP